VTGDVRDGATTKVGLAKDGPGTWVLSGTGSGFSAGTTVTQGTLVATSAAALGTGTVAVQGGILRIERDASLGPVAITGGRLVLPAATPVAVAMASLTIGGTAEGLIDVGRGRLTIAGGGGEQVLRAALATGRSDGSWNGSAGITSSAVMADLQAGVPRSLGWLDAGDGTLSIAYAAPGDTNIDGGVDILDAANFMAGGAFDSGVPGDWSQGDFGYDGLVDILDAAEFMATGLFDVGDYRGGAGLTTPVPVPEPAACGLTAAIGMLVAARRLRPRAPAPRR
jgi:autotransporter-associated beta strand protein